MKYKTAQRKQLYDFLKVHPHSCFTVKQIEERLTGIGTEISVSAIYRNLSALLEMGVIKKVAEKDSRQTSYRYVNSDICRNEIHITCSVCGKIFHMNHALAYYIQQQLAQQNDFQIDRSKTTIWGICKDCGRTAETEPSARNI